MQISRYITYTTLSLAPALAFAEVSDKMPTITDHWTFAVPVAILLFLVSRLRWQLGVLLLVVPVTLFAGVVYLRFFDSVGLGLVKEQGEIYFLSKTAASGLALLGNVLGIWRGRKRVSDSTMPNAA